jgi:hypothetical protein
VIACAENVGEKAAWVAGHTHRVDHYTGFTPDGRISDELVYMVRCSATRSSGAASLLARSLSTRTRYRRSETAVTFLSADRKFANDNQTSLG